MVSARTRFSSCVRSCLVLLVALPLLVDVASAARVVSATPRRVDGWLVVDVHAVDLLDERTRSTVESGLPGSCVLLVELRDSADAVAATHAIERSLALDLWENVVRLTEGGSERVFTALDTADSAWSRFDAVRLRRWGSLNSGATYQLHVSVHVQPLGSEERERVSRWVSQSDEGERREFAIDVGGLVRRFVKGSSSESDASVWKSAPFTLQTFVESEPTTKDEVP